LNFSKKKGGTAARVSKQNRVIGPGAAARNLNLYGWNQLQMEESVFDRKKYYLFTVGKEIGRGNFVQAGLSGTGLVYAKFNLFGCFLRKC
jgi:hypothetical protein